MWSKHISDRYTSTAVLQIDSKQIPTELPWSLNLGFESHVYDYTHKGSLNPTAMRSRKIHDCIGTASVIVLSMLYNHSEI